MSRSSYGWDAISTPAKDLLALMLRKDPTERITAAAALAHPWLADSADLHQLELPRSSLANLNAYRDGKLLH